MAKLFLYLVDRTDEVGYDEYDSFVCIAKSPDAAALMNPCEGNEPDPDYPQHKCCTWPIAPNQAVSLKVTLLGRARPNQSAGIVLSSFNAG